MDTGGWGEGAVGARTASTFLFASALTAASSALTCRTATRWHTSPSHAATTTRAFSARCASR
eukprot:scaffold29758_cov45-Isochrysis_galbana.AAC.1